jgi:hypothetical protein
VTAPAPDTAILDRLASLATAVETLASRMVGAPGPAAVAALCGPVVAEHVRILSGQVTLSQQEVNREHERQAEEHKRRVMARREAATGPPASIDLLLAREQAERHARRVVVTDPRTGRLVAVAGGSLSATPGQTLEGDGMQQRSRVLGPRGPGGEEPRMYSDHEGDGLGRPRPLAPAAASEES